MKKITAVLSLTWLLATPAFASCPGECPYYLDWNVSGLGRLASDSFNSISHQSATYFVTNTGSKLYGATSPAGRTAVINALSSGNPQGDVSLPSSGIVAFEFEIENAPASLPSVSGTSLTLSSGVSTGNWNGSSTPSGDFLEYGLSLRLAPTGATLMTAAITFASGTQTVGTSSIPVSLPLASGTRVGFYINMDTRRFGYTVNGSDIGYIKDSANNFMTVPAGVSAVSLFIGGSTSGVQSTESLLGQAIGGRLITKASEMNQPFPSGAKDICGNTI